MANLKFIFQNKGRGDETLDAFFSHGFLCFGFL